MSNLSELLPSGGGQNVVEFTASGAVASGKPVILNSDGTVTEVSESAASTGTPTSFDNNSSNSFAVTCDVNSGKVVIAYRDGDSGGYAYAVVATVSDTSISYGTKVVFNSANTGSIDICYDSSNNKVVICYENEGTNYGTAVVGTVSGTSISFGSASTFYTGTNGTEYIGCDFDSNANKVCVVYRAGATFYGQASIGTVSGTSISFGTAVVFSSQTSNWMDTVFYASQNRMLVSYQNAGDSNYGYCIAGLISGTSISFGSAVALPSSAKTIYGRLAYDSVNEVAVYAFRNFLVTDYGEAIVVTVSSSSVVTYGTATAFSTNTSNWLSPVYDIKTGKIVIAWNDAPSGSENGKLIVGTVSGTSISFGTASTFQSGNSLYMAAGYDSVTERTVIAYRQPTTNYSVGVVYRDLSTNLTATNFIGLASAAISDTASGDINVKGGINEVQTGLTIGSDYYVQTDGTLATTADTPSVKVGQAISATTINMMDLT